VYLVWFGLVLVLLRLLELWPIADLSWWVILTPFALALVWFEFIEHRLGRDRRQLQSSEHEQRRQQRLAQQWAPEKPAPRAGGSLKRR